MQIYARFCVLPFVFIRSKIEEDGEIKKSEQKQIFLTNELKYV